MSIAVRIVIFVIAAFVLGFVTSLMWNLLGFPPDLSWIGIAIAVGLALALEEALARSRPSRPA